MTTDLKAALAEYESVSVYDLNADSDGLLDNFRTAVGLLTTLAENVEFIRPLLMTISTKDARSAQEKSVAMLHLENILTVLKDHGIKGGRG